MLKQISVAAISTMLAACAYNPRAFVSTTSSPTEAAIECAVETVKKIGYTIKSESGGSMTAEKKTSNEVKENVFAFLDIVTGSLKSANKTYSKMTVLAFYAPSGETRLRVTTWQAQAGGDIGSSSSKPTARGVSDAQQVLKACGKGDITEEVCSARKMSSSVTGCGPT